jgi:hypothetical protein
MILFLLAINHLSIVFNHPRAADFDAPPSKAAWRSRHRSDDFFA